jgi:hypothetical protein
MELDGGAVQREDFDSDGDDLLLLQREEDTPQNAVLRPAVDPFVKAVPIAVARGQPPPFAPVFNGVQETLEKRKVVDHHVSALPWEKVAYPFKLYGC